MFDVFYWNSLPKLLVYLKTKDEEYRVENKYDTEVESLEAKESKIWHCDMSPMGREKWVNLTLLEMESRNSWRWRDRTGWVREEMEVEEISTKGLNSTTGKCCFSKFLLPYWIENGVIHNSWKYRFCVLNEIS
jgi:hypothetical protein